MAYQRVCSYRVRLRDGREERFGDDRAGADARACWLVKQGHTGVEVLSMGDRYPANIVHAETITPERAERTQSLYATSWRTTRERIGD